MANEKPIWFLKGDGSGVDTICLAPPPLCERLIIECHKESREWISATDLYSLEQPRGFTAHLPLSSIQLHSLSVT